MKMIHFTWFGVRTMPSCIVLIHWAMKATQPGSRCTENSGLQPLDQLQYQLCLINKVYFSMPRKLVIPAISYSRQISQTAVHKLAIHTAQKDIISVYCNVLRHSPWKCYFLIRYTGEEAGNLVKKFFFNFFWSILFLAKNWVLDGKQRYFSFLQIPKPKSQEKRHWFSHTFSIICLLPF